MLGAVASLLVVVGKRMQQLPTMFKPESTKERIQPIRLCKPCVMHVRGPNNVGRAVQTDPTLLLMLWQSQNKTNVGSCRLKSSTGFKLCVTTPNNTQQHATGCANG